MIQSSCKAKTTAITVLLMAMLSGCQSYLTHINPPPLQPGHSQLLPDSWSERGLEDGFGINADSMQVLYDISRDLVEDYFELSLQEVRLELAANSKIERIVRRETQRLTNAVFDSSDFAKFFVDKVMEDQTGSYAGLFVHPENAVLVNSELLEIFLSQIDESDTRLRAESILALLIHELVHAADNKRYQIHSRRTVNFRGSVAQSAVFEGHAQLATRDICENSGCARGLTELDKFMFEAPEPTDPVARSLQAISRNVLEYSYVEGERFVKGLRDRSDGQQHLDNVLLKPPGDPVQILTPETYPNTDRDKRNETVLNIIGALEHPWNRTSFAMIETSPIKGIDIRDDPERRAATKEGFTKLITSMIGLQVFNQSAKTLAPIEVSVMQTDTSETARLFAYSFYEKASSGSKTDLHTNTLYITLGEREGIGQWPMRVYVTLSNLKDGADSDTADYASLVASAGNWIIQIGGLIEQDYADMLHFSEAALLELVKTDI